MGCLIALKRALNSKVDILVNNRSCIPIIFKVTCLCNTTTIVKHPVEEHS